MTHPSPRILAAAAAMALLGACLEPAIEGDDVDPGGAEPVVPETTEDPSIEKFPPDPPSP